MRDPSRKVVIMQWFVIAVIIIGAGVAVFMLVNKTNEYKDQLDQQKGNIDSLREQVRQSKISPTPSVDPLPVVSNRPIASPTPSPTPTPAPRSSIAPKH